MDVSVYTKSDYKRDEDSFEKSVKTGNVNWNSFSRLMTYDLCTRTSVIENGCIGDINLRDVELALKYPEKGWRILLSVSEQLMRVSPHYLRMNNLYSNMPLFCWAKQRPCDIDTETKLVQTAAGFLGRQLEM